MNRWALATLTAMGLPWLLVGTAWALSAPAPEPDPRERIVIGGLAADQCGATPDAPVIAGGAE